MSRQARLGLVVIAGLVAAMAALFIVANRSNLLTDTFTVRATFDRVAGLQTGATVFYNGISVGRVEAVELPREPGAPITVRMAVTEDARPLIREDSQALIQTDGLVGNVIVALSGGSSQRPQIVNDGTIQGVNPLDLSQFSDKAIESVQRLDSVTIALAGTIGDVRSGEGTLGRFLYDDALYDATVATTVAAQTATTRLTDRADVALTTFTNRADALVLVAEDASRSVEQILAKVNSGDGTVARFLNDDEVYTTFLATASQLQQAATEFQTVSADVRNITDRFENAAGWASLGAFRFSENMEALKHNFLFKSYFEDRGYYEMAPFEVREEAIGETLEDLQEWERRLYQQQREIEAAQAEMARVRAELERQGVTLPPAPAPADPVLLDAREDGRP